MAGILFHANSGEITLVAATAKTCYQIQAPTNQRVILSMLSITGKQPAGGTDVPVRIRLTRSTSNFGTGTTATPGKNNPSDPETIQSVIKVNLTVEPTSPVDTGLWWEVQPQSGIISFYPPDLRIEIPGGSALNVEILSPATPIILVTASQIE